MPTSKNEAVATLSFRLTTAKDIGRVRAEQQDHVAAGSKNWRAAIYHNECFVVLADGAGGHYGGETASRLVAETHLDLYSNATRPWGEKDLIRSIETSHRHLDGEVAREPRLSDMKSTVVTLLLSSDGVARYAHCGDSRLYIYREGRLHQLTADHNVFNEQVTKYGKAPEDLFGEFFGPFYRNEIMGGEPALAMPDHLTACMDPATLYDSTCGEVGCQAGDIFLLCSDGLAGVVRDSEVESLIRNRNTGLKNLAQALITAANDAGGPDNISVGLVEVLTVPSAVPVSTEIPEVRDHWKEYEVVCSFYLEALRDLCEARQEIEQLETDRKRAEPLPPPPSKPPVAEATTTGEKTVSSSADILIRDLTPWYQRYALHLAAGFALLCLILAGTYVTWLYLQPDKSDDVTAVADEATENDKTPLVADEEVVEEVAEEAPEAPTAPPTKKIVSDDCAEHAECQDGLSCIESRCVMATEVLLQADSDADGVPDAYDLSPNNSEEQGRREPTVMRPVPLDLEGGPSSKEPDPQVPGGAETQIATRRRTCKKSFLFVDYLSRDCE